MVIGVQALRQEYTRPGVPTFVVVSSHEVNEYQNIGAMTDIQGNPS